MSRGVHIISKPNRAFARPWSAWDRGSCLHPDDAPHHLRLVVERRFLAGIVGSCTAPAAAASRLTCRLADPARRLRRLAAATVKSRRNLPGSGILEGNLRGAPALLELPADRPRPPIISYRGASDASDSDRRWRWPCVTAAGEKRSAYSRLYRGAEHPALSLHRPGGHSAGNSAGRP